MSQTSGTRAAVATGGLIFAATLMIIIGIFQVLTGVAAVARRAFFASVGNNYLYNFDTRSWGWVHIGVGIVAILAGFALFTGSAWARAIGIALATISAISFFFFVPYYPLWSLLVIALNIFAIWAMATGREPGRRSSMPAGARGEMHGTPGMGQESGQRWPATNPGASYGTPEPGRRAPDIANRPGGQGQQEPMPGEYPTPAGRPMPGREQGGSAGWEHSGPGWEQGSGPMPGREEGGTPRPPMG